MSIIEKAVERLEEKQARGGRRAEGPGSDGAASESRVGAGRVDVDIRRLESLGYLVPGSGNSRLMEEYRSIKRPLIRNAFAVGDADKPESNLVMVTSAVPGEGKTFTSLNLALSMALERDYTVLLVDADVVDPSLSGLLGTRGEKGLIDRLEDPSLDLGEMILQTDIEKLRVLPAGTPHTHSTELLASTQMKKVATELSERYRDRIVVFDSPPLLATSQAGVLAQIMGQVLVVVEASRTPQYIVNEAVSFLETEDKPVGVILNKSRHSYGDYYASYYYGYGNSTRS